MIDFERFLQNMLSDLRVELTDEFDRNFERKAFFTTPWAHTARAVNRGSLMLRTGALRASIQSTNSTTGIAFSSSLPYASIHNLGGTLTVTTKMKKFFWAMFYKESGGGNGRPATLSAEAAFWRAMALQKTGKKIKIPQRQFIGHHQEVDKIVREIVDLNVQDIARDITAQLQRINPNG